VVEEPWKAKSVYGTSEREVELTEKSSLIYVKYLDHIEVKNADPSLLGPSIREAVGWLKAETDETLCLVYDRSVKPLPNE